MSETSTVVEHVDHESQTATLASPKFKTKFIVYKPRLKYQFFSVRTTQGPLPEALSGQYSSLEAAIKLVSHYLDNAKETFAAKSDRLDQERKERHATKPNSSDSK